MCGNRHPGAGKGFYMSDKINATGLADRKCSICKIKKTITPKHDLCGSCLAVKAKKTRKKPQIMVSKDTTQAWAKETRGVLEKAAYNENMNVEIDFTKYPGILNQIQKLADDQVRPVDGQIIFLLKSHFSEPNMG
jgi:hypothetical protein